MKRPNTRKPTPDEKTKFTAHKFDLLNKAVLDANITDLQYRLLAYIVSKYLWKSGDKAFPGYDRLGEEFGASYNAIREALDRLEVRGYFRLVMQGKRGRGEDRANEYELGDGPKTYQRRIYKPRKASTYDKQTAARKAVCGKNQTAAWAESDCRLGVNQTAAQAAPNSMEGTLWKKHTQQIVCEKGGKSKKEKPAPDMSDITDAEAREWFKDLVADDDNNPSLDGSPSLNGGNPTNGGHPGNGHDPDPPTVDLDAAVAAYLTCYPMDTGKPDIVRREMANVLTAFQEIMGGLSYHKGYIWPTKDDRYIPAPENFLINGTWKKVRRSASPPPPPVEPSPEIVEEEPSSWESIRPVDVEDQITVLETMLEDPSLSAVERDDLRQQIQDMRQAQISKN